MDEFRRAGGAYIGTAPWAYGGVYRPETQRVDGFGMVWAGDPPHESPGWYDLYDSDTAMDIVAQQQRTIAEWIRLNGSNGTCGDRGRKV
jgi:mannan endo-1,4-beta-mannosidase